MIHGGRIERAFAEKAVVTFQWIGRVFPARELVGASYKGFGSPHIVGKTISEGLVAELPIGRAGAPLAVKRVVLPRCNSLSSRPFGGNVGRPAEFWRYAWWIPFALGGRADLRNQLIDIAAARGVAVEERIRGHMAEFGLVAPIGREGLAGLLQLIQAGDDRLPQEVRACLTLLVEQFALVNRQILETDRRIRTSARATEAGRRLMTIPGVGPLLARALVATVADPKGFKTGRNLAAWIGLVPKQNSSGGKERLGGITKQGDRYLRQLLVVGALAVVRYAQRHGTRRPWLVRLLERRPTKVATVARANKIARMAWAVMTTGQDYREPELRAA